MALNRGRTWNLGTEIYILHSAKALCFQLDLQFKFRIRIVPDLIFLFHAVQVYAEMQSHFCSYRSRHPKPTPLGRDRPAPILFEE